MPDQTDTLAPATTPPPQATPASGAEGPNSRRPTSPWRVIGWISAAVILASLLACSFLAAMRSAGLISVTVTAKNEKIEPRDIGVPLRRGQESLPDYQAIVLLTNGKTINLGTMIDASAVGGITWKPSAPISVADIATVRIQDDDRLLSDPIAEVQIANPTTASGDYQFQFQTQRSLTLGIQSFFQTPIGIAIATAFLIAVLLMLLGVFAT